MTARHLATRLAVRPESEVLLRQIDSYLLSLRAGAPAADLPKAERIAGALRQIIDDTAHACAGDRARVRAAVHYFVANRGAFAFAAQYQKNGVNQLDRRVKRPERPEPRRWRSVAEPDRVVNELLRELGRADLVVTAE